MLILSQYVEPAFAMRLIGDLLEGVGYLLKEPVFDAAILVDALRRIGDGECVIDPTIVARLTGRRREKDPLADLTGREREVLSLLAEGLSNTAIARRLSVAERTVEAHTIASPPRDTRVDRGTALAALLQRPLVPSGTRTIGKIIAHLFGSICGDDHPMSEQSVRVSSSNCC